MLKRHYFKSYIFFNILKQAFFFFDFSVDSSFKVFNSRLHLFGFGSDISSCIKESVMLFYGIKTDFGGLIFIGPSFCTVGSNLKLVSDCILPRQEIQFEADITATRVTSPLPPPKESAKYYSPAGYQMTERNLQGLCITEGKKFLIHGKH